MIARFARFATTSARHALPVGGVFAANWHPAAIIAVYWIESVLLVLATAGLCYLLKRRTDDASIAALRLDGREDEIRAIEDERRELRKAAIEPGDVLLFYLGSLFVFAGFLGGVITIMIGNGHLESMRWHELSDGAQAMALVVAIGLAIDLWRFEHFTVAAVAARVNDCLVRWSLFWLLGFVGTILIAVTGRPMIFFGFFAALKIIFESWARLARFFGWKSLKDRQADAANAG